LDKFLENAIPIESSVESGIAECKYEFPSSPTLLPKEKGARILVPSPVGRGLG